PAHTVVADGCHPVPLAVLHAGTAGADPDVEPGDLGVPREELHQMEVLVDLDPRHDVGGWLEPRLRGDGHEPEHERRHEEEEHRPSHGPPYGARGDSFS